MDGIIVICMAVVICKVLYSTFSVMYGKKKSYFIVSNILLLLIIYLFSPISNVPRFWTYVYVVVIVGHWFYSLYCFKLKK